MNRRHSEDAHTPSPSPLAPGVGLGKRFSIAFPSAAALIKRSKLEYLALSQTAQASFAENYVGLPY